jgi:hypothetical protein
MTGKGCWVVEDYTYRPCPEPAKEFAFAVSLHNHSCHSVEKLSSINEVVKLRFMRPFRKTLQASFGLAAVPDLNYSEIYYQPPLTAEEVFLVESTNVAELGFGGLLVGITDHDEVSGSLELRQKRPADALRNPLGEELSFRYLDYLFHLGITGLPEAGIAETHTALQAAAHEDRLDDLFEILRASGCLTVLNHALVPWGKDPGRTIPVQELLARYGWAIHALEYNGMRSREENDRVLQLAKHVGKPVVGGGDSHLLLASSVLSVSQAGSFEEYAAEVKAGRAISLITPMFDAPLSWKIFLRVLYFIGHYREIGHFRGQPVSELLGDRTVLLDPVGFASRGFLSLAEALGMVR